MVNSVLKGSASSAGGGCGTGSNDLGVGDDLYQLALELVSDGQDQTTWAADNAENERKYRYIRLPDELD